MRFGTLLAGAVAVTTVTAHPGEDHHHEQAERNAALQHTSRNLDHCAAKIKARGLEARSVQRRSKTLASMLKKRNLQERDLSSLTTSHHSSESYTLDTPETTVFATNNSCVLSPEVTEGPYYVAGEYVRKNIIESQTGVDITIDLQVLDMETCEPVTGAYLEIWHCNSTGVYSGVSASGNGNGDASNLDATFLRGVQQTDSDGVVQFETLFPGHYTGRTNHIHVMVHLDATPAANGTLLDVTATHVGQLFFDQSLVTEVEATSVYATNTQTQTLNDEDDILAQEAASSDPFPEYVLLGDSVSDGLFAWIAFGVNTSLTKTVSNAATYYATGGVANANAGGGGGPGGAGGPGGSGAPGGNATAPGRNGTMPGGNGTVFTSQAPSGTASAVSSAASSVGSAISSVASSGASAMRRWF